MRREELTVKYVDYMPNTKEEGILYVSKKFSIAIHLCPCGCGEQVVTPIKGDWPGSKSRPDCWGFTEHDDGTVSLSPSIGNFQFKCRSHYFIRHNKIEWV